MIENLNLYTDLGVKINNRIKHKLTFYFPFTDIECFEKSRAKELELKSYVYDVYSSQGKQIGLAVPK